MMEAYAKRADAPQPILTPRLIFLIVLSAALLFISNFRFGFSVKIGEWESEGIYSLRQLRNAVALAEAAADELLCEDVDLWGNMEVSLRLTSGGLEGETYGLENALLESAPGIDRLYAVKVDGEIVGWVSDFSGLGEAVNDMLAEKSTPYTVSAGFDGSITIEYGFAPSDISRDIMDVLADIRELTSVQVINVEPGEAVEVSGLTGNE